ncbi:hypothetical protein Q7P35_011982 [Cladosporium inversicolor]
MKYALITLPLTVSTLALPTKQQAASSADVLNLDKDITELVHGLENRLESLTAGVAERDDDSNAGLKNIHAETVGPMLHEIESLFSSLTAGIAKREVNSSGLLDIKSMPLGEVESLLGGLAGGIVKRQESSSDVLAISSMLHEFESILGSITGGIAKRQDSGDLSKDAELAASMLAEVKTLISSLTHGIAKHQATSGDALDLSPENIDALIDSLHKLMSILKGGIAKRQDTADIAAVVEITSSILQVLNHWRKKHCGLNLLIELSNYPYIISHRE